MHERAWSRQTLPGTKVGRRQGSHLWADPHTTSEPRALRTPPTQPDAQPRHSGSGRGGAVAECIRRRPQASTDLSACRPRHPWERPPRSHGCGQEPPPTPARIERLRPSPAWPAARRPKRAGLGLDRAAGPQLRPQRSGSVGESRGWWRGPPGPDAPPHSPWRLP